MTEYRVEITIDVDAETPLSAARTAWSLLTDQNALLPVCDVFDGDGNRTRIDLQEFEGTTPETAPATVTIRGQRFVCEVCGVGIFARHGSQYTCNGCGAVYEGTPISHEGGS